jgi:Mrp family chromosome partitioning ATPase
VSVVLVGSDAPSVAVGSSGASDGVVASESREPHWISDSYLMPSEVSHLLTHLRSVRGALMVLVGLQGVGKSSALLAIATSLRQTKVPGPTSSACYDTILFKWRRASDLYKSLMDYDHDASLEFRSKYGAEMTSLSSSRRTLSYRHSGAHKQQPDGTLPQHIQRKKQGHASPQENRFGLH